MSEQQGQDSIDLKVVFRKLAGKWWLFVATIGVFVALAIAYLKTTPKQFAVTGVMLMSEKKRNNFGSSNEEFLKGTSYLSSNGELEDQISVLMSYGMVLETIKRLDFGVSYFEEKNFTKKEAYTAKPFIVRLDTGEQVTDVPIQIIPDMGSRTFRVKAEGKNVRMFNATTQKDVDDFVPKWKVDEAVAMDKPFRSEHLSFHIEWPAKADFSKSGKFTIVLHSPDGLASGYRGKTTTSPQSDESNIVTVTTAGEVVQKEIDFVNMLMATYIKAEQDKQNDKGKKTIKFIDDQLDESSKDLSTAEGNLQSAQATGGSLMGTADSRASAVYNDLSRQREMQGRLRAKLISLTDLVSTMSNDNGGAPSTVSAANIDAPALNTLVDQYNRDVGDLETKRLSERIPSAPTIALGRRVQTERNQIIQSAQSLQRQTQVELDQVNGLASQLNGQLSALPQSSRQVEVASRKYKITEDLNNYLTQKRYEAEIAVASDQVDKFIVDSARVSGSGPVSPDKKVALGGALLLGLLLPILFILARDFFNDRIADQDELKRLSPVPLLSTIPSSKNKRITVADGRSMLAESFRTARINLQYLNADVSRQVVGLTSSTSGEGKTFCSINMATVMAMSGKRTLLIDADMRRPRVHEYIGLPEGKGLSTFLIGECGIDQIIQRSDVAGLDVITAGPIPPNPLELVESPRLAELFQQMRERYDHIVVDASPMGLVSEFKILVKYLDVTLYVVRQGYTRRGMLRPLNELYKDGKLSRVDLLLNDVKAGEGYGYVYEEAKGK